MTQEGAGWGQGSVPGPQAEAGSRQVLERPVLLESGPGAGRAERTPPGLSEATVCYRDPKVGRRRAGLTLRSPSMLGHGNPALRAKGGWLGVACCVMVWGWLAAEITEVQAPTPTPAFFNSCVQQRFMLLHKLSQGRDRVGGRTQDADLQQGLSIDMLRVGSPACPWVSSGQLLSPMDTG